MANGPCANVARDPEFLKGLLVRATTLDERLSAQFEPVAEQIDEAAVKARLTAWQRASTSGDEALFAQRLARDGWSVESASAQLGTIRLSPSHKEPEWWADARWIYGALLGDGGESRGRRPKEPLPFEHLFWGVLSVAEGAVFAQGRGAALTVAARARLGRDLLGLLCDLCGPALYEVFSAASCRIAPRAPLGRDSGYRRFIENLQRGAIADLFSAKPVLLRLLASMTRQWIDATRELVERLDADIGDLRGQFISGDAGRVESVRSGLSDFHNEGRSVHVLSFENGQRVVYKPKDIRLDACWFVLVQSLNALAPPVELRAARVLVRDGYGWSEFVEHHPCGDKIAVERYFFRAGAWLALFHVTAATDMHYENIIAAGEHPVPIDLEMLLQPSRVESLERPPENAAADAALDVVLSSVLNVGLLPVLGAAANHAKFELGGLKGGAPRTRKACWANVNTDVMTMQIRDSTGPSLRNLPELDGRRITADAHVDPIVTGFERYANFIVKQREAFIAALAPFERLPVRYVVRPTRFYALLIERLKQHRAMADGGVWSAQADFVSRLANWDLGQEAAWPLSRSERRALVALNVPYFSYHAAREKLSGGGVTVSVPVSSGTERAAKQLRRLERSGFEHQSKIIRLSLGEGASGGVARRLDTSVVPVSEAEIRQEIEAIAQSLTRSALWVGKGAAWTGLEWSPDADICQLTPLGYDLYGGAPGVSIFLAAHARLTGNEKSRELALAGVAALRGVLRGGNVARVARGLGIGGGLGLGSAVYALVVLAELTESETLIEDASLAAALITQDLISADKRFDVIGGAAGAILGLLRLYAATGEAAALQPAIACANHIVQHASPFNDTAKGFAPLNGLSHGLSGYALALNRLAAASGCAEFTRAALACVTCENESYNEDRQNWPDRRGGSDAWPCQWCHGAAGIGLARMGIKRSGGFPNDDILDRDLRRALGGVLRAGLHRLDTLCCGAFGNIEFLLSAAETLDCGNPKKLAWAQISAVVRTAESEGDYRWSRGDREVNVGLYRGLAGVGYGMMRALDRSLPSILTWD